MLEPVVFLLFVVLPFVLGYWAANYLAAVVPGLVLVLSIIALRTRSETGDEVDAIPGILVAASVIAILVCLVGAALARRSPETSASSK